MKEKVSVFDPSEYLETEEDIAEYLTAVMEEGDVETFVAALGDVAKARGMSIIAQETGLGRESLYKSFKAGSKPRFDTIFKVLNSMGVHLEFKPNIEKAVVSI
jgi:probable addiction module antidote protein